MGWSSASSREAGLIKRYGIAPERAIFGNVQCETPMPLNVDNSPEDSGSRIKWRPSSAGESRIVDADGLASRLVLARWLENKSVPLFSCPRLFHLVTNYTTAFHKECRHHRRPSSYLGSCVDNILLRHMKSFPNNRPCLHNCNYPHFLLVLYESMLMLLAHHELG